MMLMICKMCKCTTTSLIEVSSMRVCYKCYEVLTDDSSRKPITVTESVTLAMEIEGNKGVMLTHKDGMYQVRSYQDTKSFQTESGVLSTAWAIYFDKRGILFPEKSIKESAS